MSDQNDGGPAPGPYQYERIIEAVGDGIYVLDEDGRFVEFTDSFADLIGADPAEIEGNHPERWLAEEDVEAFQTAIEDLLSEDGPSTRTVEATLETTDGGEIVVEVTLTLLQSDEVFHGTVGVVRDITERKAREQELQRYETLLDLIPDTVVVTDIDGRHVELHGHQGWSGYSRDELIGEHISVTTPPGGIEKAEAAISELLTSDDLDKVTYEQDVVTKDGESVPMESHITLLPPDDDGRVPGSITVLRNISERKERERELERQNERLEKFASIVSHDLRNPLSIISGYVDLAEQTGDPEHFDRIRSAADRMERLIDDLLTLAREGQTVGETEPVAIRSVAQTAWLDVDASGATLDIEEDIVIDADEHRLTELLGNLFRNAAEHAGPEVTVRVGALPNGFYVEDDGPGIPPDDREEVFERGVTTSPDGTGYGLAIVRDIADAHGWTIRLTEGTDGGARFEFTAPASGERNG